MMQCVEAAGIGVAVASLLDVKLSAFTHGVEQGEDFSVLESASETLSKVLLLLRQAGPVVCLWSDGDSHGDH